MVRSVPCAEFVQGLGLFRAWGFGTQMFARVYSGFGFAVGRGCVV